MNTPAHLIFAAAAFGKPDQDKVTRAALIGGFLPDLSLYLMAAVSIFILGITPRYVFDVLYFSDPWQQIFAIDNSFVLWGIGLAVALYKRSAVWIAVCGGALLHLVFDFPLHNEDARMHFWPITDWKFHSPYSYWNGADGAGIVSMIEMTLVVVLTIFLLIRYKTLIWRAVFLALAALQILPTFMWYFVFSQ